MANDDGVGVAADDADGVFDRLALDGRRELARILGRDDVAAELVHRRLERKAGARRRLVEDGRQRESGKRRRLSRQVSHAVGGGEEPLDTGPVELPDLDDVAHRGDRLAIHCVPSRRASIVAAARRSGASEGKRLGILIPLADRAWVMPGGVNIGVLANDDGQIVLVDTGLNESSAKKALKVVREELGGEVVAVLTTHAHADHFGGNATIVKRTGAVVHAPRFDEAFLRYPLLQPASSSAAPIRSTRCEELPARRSQPGRCRLSSQAPTRSPGSARGCSALRPLTGTARLPRRRRLLLRRRRAAANVLDKYRIPISSR